MANISDPAPSQQPQRDQDRAGILAIAPMLIGHLLRLPAGQQIVKARMGPFETLEFVVEGAGLPPRQAGVEPEPVMLMMRAEYRAGDVKKGGQQRRTICWWAHDTSTTWVLRDWSYEP
jgi:hypothetical protein